VETLIHDLKHAFRSLRHNPAFTLTAVSALALGVAGLAVAFALTRFMSTMLFGVTPRDPVVFLTVALIPGAVTLLATYFRARHAVRTDPMVALRYQ